MAVWRSSNGVGHINEVTLRRARLVMGWVTVVGRAYHLGMQTRWRLHARWLLRPTQPGREMCTGQSAMMLCGYGVKAGWLIPFVDKRVGGR